MGTYWKIHAQIPPSVQHSQLQQTLEQSFATIIQQMSHWDPSSELSQFNQAPPNSWHTLSPEFFFVLKRALEIAKLTNGAYDPTVGKLVDLYGFGPSSVEDTLPTEESIQKAHLHSGWSHIKLDPHHNKAFQPGAWSIDLSSIAKGFAIDHAASKLESLGLTDFLLEIGGEFRGKGCKPSAQPWWVLLEPYLRHGKNPLPENLVALCDLSLATSGNGVRQRQCADSTLSHIISPKTTHSVHSSIVSVSVLATDCMEADAWATALFTCDPDLALQLAEQESLTAHFTTLKNDTLNEFWSSQFARLFE